MSDVRLFVADALQPLTELTLPPGATRHAQVRRVQPGDVITLFDGCGADWPATVLAVERKAVRVRTGTPQPVDRELAVAVTLALAMPANDRMDTLVEKAAELGVARVQPLLSERSVLRLGGERAARKREHWQAIAESACEQCGRARVPHVAAVQPLADWLQAIGQPGEDEARWLLSLSADAQPLAAGAAARSVAAITTLSGPEGGLTDAECRGARAAGFADTGLGPRVLRADTAPLAVLAWIALRGPIPVPVPLPG